MRKDLFKSIYQKVIDFTVKQGFSALPTGLDQIGDIRRNNRFVSSRIKRPTALQRDPHKVMSHGTALAWANPLKPGNIRNLKGSGCDTADSRKF